MKILIVQILILFCLITTSYSQPATTDSITKLLSETTDESERARLLFLRSKTYPQAEFEKTKSDASEALNLFKKINNFEGEVEATLQIANAYSRQSKYQQALSLDSSALALAKQHNYLLGQAYALSNIGRNLAQLGNLKDAEEAYKGALNLMLKTGNEKETADIRNRLGIMYFRSSRYQQSLANYDTGIMVASRYNMELLLSYLYMNKANNLSELTHYDEALEYHLKSAAIKEKLKDEKGLMQSYTNIGNLYSRIKMPRKAIPFYRKALAVATRLDNKTSMGNNYSNIAGALAQLNQTDSVPYFYTNAIGNFNQTGDKAGLAMSYHNYGFFLLSQNEPEKANEFLNRALALRRQINSKNHIANTLLILGNLQTKIGNKKQAEKFYLESLSLLKDDNGQWKADVLSELSNHYKSVGNFEKAFFYKESYAALKDTILNVDEIGRLKDIQADYEMAKKDDELSLERKDKELHKLQVTRQKNQLIFLLVTLLLVMLAGILAFVAYRNKQRYAEQMLEKKNQVETLIQELHHRVKNNLQIVSGLLSLQSIRTEEETARQVIDEGRTRLDAMALIHQKLYINDSFTMIDIKDYIVNLTTLLAESFGFSNENITTRISPGSIYLDVDYAIPMGLIVNELVTNAFKHADAANRNDLKIQVDLHNKGEKHMELVIADNGNGSEDKMFTANKASFGLSLVNTLVKQLDGKLTRSHLNGTMFSIVFSMN